MKSEIVYAIAIVAIGALGVFWIIPSQSPASTIEGDIPSALVPTLAMAVVLGGGLLRLVLAMRPGGDPESGRRSPQGEESMVGRPEKHAATSGGATFMARLLERPSFRLPAIIIVLASYILGVAWVGFYSTTALFLTLSLYLLNRMSFAKCLASALVLLAITYLLFEIGLRVSMPQGLLV
jgi:hypothetical protein